MNTFPAGSQKVTTCNENYIDYRRWCVCPWPIRGPSDHLYIAVLSDYVPKARLKHQEIIESLRPHATRLDLLQQSLHKTEWLESHMSTPVKTNEYLKMLLTSSSPLYFFLMSLRSILVPVDIVQKSLERPLRWPTATAVHGRRFLPNKLIVLNKCVLRMRLMVVK